MGDTEYHNQASEREEDYFTSAKRMTEDGGRSLVLPSTTQKTRKNAGGSLKKGKPPLIQKNSHTAVKSKPWPESKLQSANIAASNNESFSGALD